MVITGMGAVTPIGIGLRDYWESLVAGRSGVGPITLFNPDQYPIKIAAEVKDFDSSRFLDRKKDKQLGRVTQFGVASAVLALEDAGWDERPGDGKLGVATGISGSPQDAMEEAIIYMKDNRYKRILPYMITKCATHGAATETGLMTGFQDQVITVSTACSAGIFAIEYALHEIRSGRCDAFLCNATDTTVTANGFGVFCRANMLSKLDKNASRPFDAKRDGGVLGEGAGGLLLEEIGHARRRGATIYAEVLGTGTSGVGYNCNPELSVPKGMAAAMTKALNAANCGPEAIDHIGAHGVSDPHLDVWETQAIKKVFGEHAYRVPVSSVKSMIGIPQNAAGMLQVIAGVMSIQEGIITPTINYEYPDPDCDLDYVPNEARRNRINRVLVLSHGLNGSDAAIVVGRISGT